jgi:hypothetical protein
VQDLVDVALSEATEGFIGALPAAFGTAASHG